LEKSMDLTDEQREASDVLITESPYSEWTVEVGLDGICLDGIRGMY
jgi:hypothetical protein